MWLTVEIFDHYEPVKDEIWQNPKILNHFENLAQNWDFWPPRMWEWWNLAKSRNFESIWKFGSKLRFLTTPDLQKMEFGKIQKFCSKLSFDHSGPKKDEICQNPEIFIHFKICLKIGISDHSEPLKDEIW